MTEHELIAKQALEIENLKEELASYKESLKTIRSYLYCMGGPLNDNAYQYNKDQLKVFFLIAQEFEDHYCRAE